MNPRSSHTITHGLFIFNGVREPQAVCQVAQADTQAKTWQRVCLHHPDKIETIYGSRTLLKK